jgi:hypothetical protein
MKAVEALSAPAEVRCDGRSPRTRAGQLRERNRGWEDSTGPLSALELPGGVVSLQHWLDLSA